MNTAELKRILVVEDEPDIRNVARLALGDVGGFEVDLCESGAQALERVRERRPDLVLLDVMMPELDGPATLARLREDPATASVPVVFMTAKVQPREVSGYLEAGAIGVISKPFDPMTLHESVRDLWEKAGTGVMKPD